MGMPLCSPTSWPSRLDDVWSQKPLTTASEGRAVTTPVSQATGAWAHRQFRVLGFTQQKLTDESKQERVCEGPVRIQEELYAGSLYGQDKENTETILSGCSLQRTSLLCPRARLLGQRAWPSVGKGPSPHQLGSVNQLRQSMNLARGRHRQDSATLIFTDLI